MKTKKLQFENLGRREVFSAGPLGEIGPDVEAVVSNEQQANHAEIESAFTTIGETRTDTQRSSFMADPRAEPGKWGPPILAAGENDPTFPYERGEAVDTVYAGQEDDGRAVLLVDGEYIVGEPNPAPDPDPNPDPAPVPEPKPKGGGIFGGIFKKRKD